MAKAPSPPRRNPPALRRGRIPFVAAALTLLAAVCAGAPAGAQTREAGSVRLAQGATDAPPAQSRPTPPDPSLFDAREAFARARPPTRLTSASASPRPSRVRTGSSAAS